MRCRLTVLMMLVGVAACSGADEPADTTGPALGSTSTATVSVPPTSTPATVATTTTAAPSTTTTAPTTTTAVPRAEGPWDTWTLIYASLDTGTRTREDAEAIAVGIDDGAVLLSDDYPSLNPGFWVVHAGEWGHRRAAGAWCPQDLEPGLSCYPRYLGPSIPDLLNRGAALAQLNEGRLVALDIATGETLATFSDNFHWEAEFPAYFNLTANASQLYFGMGWEDSWYSCQSDGGEVWRLDLDSGIEEVFSAGWSPAISPNGRWLAVVVAGECYPDPQQDGWVMSPGSQIEVFDLADGDNRADHVLRTVPQPTSYETPQSVRAVRWDPAVDGDLLVWLGDGSVRRVPHDASLPLTDAPLEFLSEVGELAAVSTDHRYVVEYDGDVTAINKSSVLGDSDEIIIVDGWVTGFALGRSGDVIITTWEHLLLPSGERIPIDGGVNNLAW